jgi:hypothetical protein
LSWEKVSYRLDSHPLWLGILIIISAVLLGSALFLQPSALEFPMDDTYIHFVYAENLIKQNKMFFNSPDEAGIGSTSLGWVLLLAGGYKLGLSMHVLAKLLGIIFLILVGVCLYLLLRSSWNPFPALACTLLVVVSGNMLWFALSGMETMMFLGLGLTSLLLYRGEKWLWLGLVLGLLVITRIEGLALIAAIIFVDIWYRRGISRGLLITALFAALICGSWIVYIYQRTGIIIPTSGAGKIFALRLATKLVVERNQVFAFLGKYPSVLYPFIWAVYMFEFVLGGMAFPPPRIPAGKLLGNPDYTFSAWALIGLVGIVIPLVLAFIKEVGKSELRKDWLIQVNGRPMLIFGLWVILHNLAYMVFLPIPGTASRYGAINHIVLWIILGVGVFSFVHRTRLWIWFAGSLVVIAIINTVYWQGVYQANLEHMLNVRMRAAHYIATSRETGGLCAAFDIGALRYYSKRRIIDLGGLVNPDLVNIYLNGELDNYLLSKKVTCLAMPGRMGISSDGWFDFIDILDLSSSPFFEIQQIGSYAIDRKTWLKGYLPTGNYQATVTLYRIIY